MRFVLFNTPRPRQFKYKPRYYDEEKERLEKRKAQLGLESELSRRETLRAQMHSKWRRNDSGMGASNLTRLIYFAFYALVIIGGVWLIFFTDFVEKLIALFGVR
jgi:hypothetical protein